ncbi:hypothetical protein EOD39_22065 [Acipenser ruthenus]|uniref:Uncharacterized protein n=1 Tax=Acipenser ruthenus TaxID=7906 RepID=A0A444UQX5_ACIRT|nr:hypothetical protein EOD39_22065 [Acipenser ruthenus]
MTIKQLTLRTPQQRQWLSCALRYFTITSPSSLCLLDCNAVPLQIQDCDGHKAPPPSTESQDSPWKTTRDAALFNNALL